MKRLILSALVLSVLGIGCAGTRKDLVMVKALNTVAVISITMNNEIEASAIEEKPGKLKSGLAGFKAVSALAKGKSIKEALAASVHTMENVVAATPTTILNNINTSAVVNLIPTDQVLSNDGYQKIEIPKGFLGSQPIISAENWKTIASTDKGMIQSAAQELGVDGVMVIDLKCKWRVWTGMDVSGTAKAEVEMTATLFAPNGDKIWTSYKSAVSDNKTGIIGGVYDWPEMDEMLLNAIDKASESLFARLKKGLDTL